MDCGSPILAAGGGQRFSPYALELYELGVSGVNSGGSGIEPVVLSESEQLVPTDPSTSGTNASGASRRIVLDKNIARFSLVSAGDRGNGIVPARKPFALAKILVTHMYRHGRVCRGKGF